MTSQDATRYVTAEMFNNGIAEIKAENRRNTEEIKAEIQALDRRIEINSVKIDELHYFMGIGFTVIAIVVGIVGFVLTLAPMFREMYRDRKQSKSERVKQDILNTVRVEMQSMIDEAISRALSVRK